jgi:hypothetical protein
MRWPATHEARYSEVTDPRAKLEEGQFRFLPDDDTQVEVYLRRNTYGWTMIGLTEKNDKVLCLACEGDPARHQKYTIEAAAGKLQEVGAHDALLMDEGVDVFQAALLGLTGPKAKVASGPPDLDITVPLDLTRPRTRLRATFLFVREKAKEGSS